MNDNRRYRFSPNSIAKRDEYQVIADLIVKPRAKVIDLGSGDGSLLLLLKNSKQVRGEGIEITQSGVKVSLGKGLKVRRGKIDTLLPYKDKQFDYAVCNVTLQMVMYPEILLREMQRISQYQIITFPNFAFILNRLELLLKGRMPKTMIPGYDWYSTGHIHQLSIQDFLDFCLANKVHILQESHIFPRSLFGSTKLVFKNYPNIFASTAIFLTQ